MRVTQQQLVDDINLFFKNIPCKIHKESCQFSEQLKTDGICPESCPFVQPIRDFSDLLRKVEESVSEYFI